MTSGEILYLALAIGAAFAFVATLSYLTYFDKPKRRQAAPEAKRDHAAAGAH